MVAILGKSDHNVDFHPIVDFIEASPLRYPLTVKPTVYVSHIRQFWSTARIETTEEGTKILATVDGLNEFSSNIATDLVCLATNRTYNFSEMIFDGLVKNVNNKVSKFLMYPRFLTMCLTMRQFGQITHTHTYVVPFHTRKLFTTLRVNSPSFSGRIVLLFDTMLVPQGEGSCTPTESHHTPSPEAHPTSHTTHSSPTFLHVTTVSILTVTPSETTPIRQYTRRARIAQSSALPPVADEPASPLRDVSEGEACPTDSDFQADQDRANIAKTFTLPHDSALRVTSPAAAEGSMQQTLNELTAFYTSLQRQHSALISKFKAQELEINRLKARVKLLEDREGLVGERIRDDAPIKGKNLDEGEAATERVSDDTEEMATVLTSMDAATVLASRVVEVPTGSRSVPTAGPPAIEVPTGSDVVPTAGLIFATANMVTPYTRRKGKETMVESETLKKKKIQEQMDIQMARHTEEEMERDAQRMNEQIARDAEVERIHVEEELQMMINSLDRSNETIENFIPMGSKEEVERFKRKGIRFEQESKKKLKTSDEVLEEVKSPDEVPKEKVKEMMQLVPIEEVYVEAFQVKNPIIDWKVHTEGQRAYWKITRLGGSSASYQFLVDLLKHMDKEDLNHL
nr:hypothetical protein [Tanacetum cinerariifolium]